MTLHPACRAKRPVVIACRTLLLATLLLLPLAVLAESEADGYFNEARDYLAKGEIRTAIIQLKNALQRDPAHIESRLLLALAYLRTGDGAAAEKEFGRAGELGADEQRWLPGYGQSLLLQNKYRELLDQLSANDGREPGLRAGVLAMRGQALLALGERDAASAAYAQALELDAGNVLARLGQARLLIAAGDFAAALREVEQLVRAHPDNVEALLTKAELHRQLRQFDQAEADFARAVELAPKILQAHVGLGLVHIAQHKPDQALADVAALRKHFKDAPLGSYVHALAAFQKGDMDSASAQLQQVLSTTPEQLQAQLLYGVVNYAQGNYQLAEEYLTRIHTRLPDEPMVGKLLAAARLKLNNTQQAIELLEPLAAGHPSDPQLLALLGTAHLQAGDNSKGAEYMARAVELAPDQALLRAQLAVGQLAAGDTPSAISELEQAVSLDQDILQADVLLVLSYLRAGEPQKALQVGERLRQRMPDSPIPLNLQGLAHLATKDFAASRAAFEAALRLDKDFLVAHMNLARLALVQEDAAEAARHYQLVLDKQADHQGALLGMAGLAQARGDQSSYEQWLSRAHQAAPGAVQPALLMAELALRKGEPLKAVTLLNDLSSQDQQRPEVLRLRGMAMIQAGQASNAVRALEQLTGQRPDYIEGWFQLARAQLLGGDAGAARSSLQRALALDTQHRVPLLLVALAELELRAENWAEALRIAEQLQQRHPDNPAGQELAAAAYRGRGDADSALEAQRRALAIAPTGARARALAGALTAAGRAPEAMQVLQDWLREHPEDSASRTALAMQQQQGGQVAAAIASYEAVLQEAPANPVLLNNLAWLYLQQGDPRAEDVARRAYDAATQRPEIVDTYGWVLFKRGKTAEGLRLLQQALVLAPRNPEIGLHVAEALHHGGRAAEARRVLDAVSRDHPGSDWDRAAQTLRQQLGD